MSQNDQFIRKKAGFSGQTRGRVSQTDTDRGLTDKRGLRFTDRHSLVFPDTCHLDFPDALHLNFPDTIYLTKATKIRNNRATVARWLGADLPPSVLEGGARLAGGPGPPRVIPRRDMVNQPQLHPVDTFAERHPANPPHGDFSLTFLQTSPQAFPQTFPQTFPQPTETSNNSILSGEGGGVLRTSESKCQFIRKKAGFHGQTWTEAPRQTWTEAHRQT